MAGRCPSPQSMMPRQGLATAWTPSTPSQTSQQHSPHAWHGYTGGVDFISLLTCMQVSNSCSRPGLNMQASCHSVAAQTHLPERLCLTSLSK